MMFESRLLFVVSAFAGSSALCARARSPGGARREAVTCSTGGVTVLMAGLPGAMGREVSAACLRKGFHLAPFSLTGPGIELETIEVTDLEGGAAVAVKLVRGPSTVDVADCEARVAAYKAECDAAGRTLVAIDYTHPTAVNANAALYARCGVSFVMGTTGGDRDLLTRTVLEGAARHGAGVFAAVVAPNMGKQIVALQATLERMARDFPGSFAGYDLRITESHQAGKADTSGTAKAIAASLATLVGPEPYDTDAIVRVRDEASQLDGATQHKPALNPVPAAAIQGHAFHTYSLVSSTGDVEFQFRHNVQGRRFYAEGTADAVNFLANQLQSQKAEATKKNLYDMIDVLEAGALD